MIQENASAHKDVHKMKRSIEMGSMMISSSVTPSMSIEGKQATIRKIYL